MLHQFLSDLILVFFKPHLLNFPGFLQIHRECGLYTGKGFFLTLTLVISLLYDLADERDIFVSFSFELQYP